MSMQFDWYIGNIDRALDTDVYDNAALLDGSAWDDFAAAIGRLGAELKRPDVPHAPVDTAAGYRHLMAMVANGIGAALIPADPYAPTFGAIARTDVYKWGLDCPDCIYRTSAIRGDLNYRVTGNVGTVRYLSFQVNEGMANHGNIRNDELVVRCRRQLRVVDRPRPAARQLAGDACGLRHHRDPPVLRRLGQRGAGQLRHRAPLADPRRRPDRPPHRHARPRGAPARGRRWLARSQHQVLERRRGPRPGRALERLRRRHCEVRHGRRPGEHQCLGALRAGTRRGLDRGSDSRRGRATGASTSGTSGGSHSTTPAGTRASTTTRPSSTTTECSAPSWPTATPVCPIGSTPWATRKARSCSAGWSPTTARRPRPRSCPSPRSAITSRPKPRP